MLTSDPWVLSTIQGGDIKFDWVPEQLHIPLEINFSDFEMYIIDFELSKLLVKVVIEPCFSGQADSVSNNFIRRKKDVSVRLILSFQTPNQAVSYHLFLRWKAYSLLLVS